MKKNENKKRDVLIFVLGILVLLFEVIYNWDGSQKQFYRGWNNFR
jgi:hypothetical protein